MELVKHFCKNCEIEIVTDIDLDTAHCFKCDSTEDLKELKTLKPQDYLDFVEGACESANEHNLSGAPTRVFEATKSLVDKKNHLELAKRISAEIYSFI